MSDMFFTTVLYILYIQQTQLQLLKAAFRFFLSSFLFCILFFVFVFAGLACIGYFTVFDDCHRSCLPPSLLPFESNPSLQQQKKKRVDAFFFLFSFLSFVLLAARTLHSIRIRIDNRVCLYIIGGR